VFLSSAAAVAQEWMRKVQAGKMTKGDKLGAVDHSTVSYPPFR
jgi:ATP-dependent RNA helicase DDX46/PRP5